jgi:hypothetical protein
LQLKSTAVQLRQQVHSLLGLKIIELSAERVLQPCGKRRCSRLLERSKQQTFQIAVRDLWQLLLVVCRSRKQFRLVEQAAITRQSFKCVRSGRRTARQRCGNRLAKFWELL